MEEIDNIYHRRTLGIIIGTIFLLFFGTIATLVGLGKNYVAMSVLICYAVSSIPFFVCLLIRNNFISYIIIDDIFNYLLSDLPLGMIKWIFNYSAGALLIPIIIILWVLIWSISIILLILAILIFPIISIVVCPIYARKKG